jgi:hypothetical protein
MIFFSSIFFFFFSKKIEIFFGEMCFSSENSTTFVNFLENFANFLLSQYWKKKPWLWFWICSYMWWKNWCMNSLGFKFYKA